MFDSIYTANTGLQSFAKGLSVISDNVTNVNTVGYKGSTLLYRNIQYNFDLRDNSQGNLYGAQIGRGVAADISSIVFTQGETRQTGKDTDVAISGKGFFVIERDGQHIYSRDGQFDFNDQGELVTRNGGYRVLGLAASGRLEPINRTTLLGLPATATTRVDVRGVLSTDATASTPVTLSNMTVYDSLGAAHNLTVTVTRNTATQNAWTVAVSENGAPVGSTGTISFQSTGAPAAGANTHTFMYQASGAAAQQITLNFGSPGSFSQVTMWSGTSSLSVASQDGHTAGSLLKMTFDEQGRMVATYSNQKTKNGPQLALARFENEQGLLQLGDGLFRAQSFQEPIIGRPGQDVFGVIAGGRVESSNVELSQQFTDMIVIQRGYQASSQVLTVANELMQQLLENNK